MLSLRKTLARWPSLMVMLGFLLLVQIQQALACDLMVLFPAPPGQDCPTHHGGPSPKQDQKQQSCCDPAFAYATAGKQCHNDQGSVIAPSLTGKLSPDFQPVFMIVGLQEVSLYPLSPTPVHTPAYKLTRPGARPYLTTQRLRI